MLNTISQDTLMGHRAHAVKTDSHELAQNLFAQALDLDIEPEISRCVGGWCVEFIASDAECFAAIQTAQNQAGR